MSIDVAFFLALTLAITQTFFLLWFAMLSMIAFFGIDYEWRFRRESEGEVRKEIVD